MKSVNVTFEDAEFERLKIAKGEMSWHDFIMAMLDITIRYQKDMTGESFIDQ